MDIHSVFGNLTQLPAGNSSPDLRETTSKNTGRINNAEVRRRIERTMALPIRSATDLAGIGRGQKLIICGGGPSIENTLPDIRRQLRLSKKVKILALNKTHDWLLSKGVKPDFSAMADPFPHVATYQTPQLGTKYLLGSILHDDTLAKFAAHDNYRDCFVWHPISVEDGDQEWMDKTFPNRATIRVAGKSTVGLRILIFMGKFLEFDTLELHGYDSCDAPDEAGKPRKLYPYSKPMLEVSFKSVVQTALDGSQLQYHANEHMARQSYEFFDALAHMAENQANGKLKLFNITVAGDGAVPWLAWKIGLHATPKRMAEKYEAHKYYDYANSKPMPEPFRDKSTVIGANFGASVGMQLGDAPFDFDDFGTIGKLGAA